MGLLLFFRGAATGWALAFDDAVSLTDSTSITNPRVNVTDTLPVSDSVDVIHVPFFASTEAQPLTPTPLLDVAFTSQPLVVNPSWANVSSRLRGVSSQRGRAYEYDRMETGTNSNILSNRDAALSPANTSSPYYPIRSTRPVRLRLLWNGVVYPVFRGISEGFPQTYPHLGQDALVELRASDLFYALNQARFTPGSTELTVAMAGGVAQNTEETITVTSTALPMPQTVPFTITVAGLTDEWPVEEMQVTAILSSTEYAVTRVDETTYEHPIGAVIETEAVSFGEALSGERIRQVLERVGFGSGWYDLDAGQTLIAASEDLASVNPLEHINLISECEFGRFFVSRAGLFTFRDRQSAYVDNLTPVMTFTGGDMTPAASDVPYAISGALEHDESKLFNHVRIVTPVGTVELEDATSIANHFRRSFEREWPYANLNDADSAARYILENSSESTLRLPALEVFGASDPSVLWPKILGREIGERVRFRYQPEGGGSQLDRELVIEGIAHGMEPSKHVSRFQCTEVPATEYWVLGMAGYTELGSTTRVGF